MTILEGTVKHDYIVTDIVMDEMIMRRLEALGINSGTKLQMMNQKKNGTVMETFTPFIYFVIFYKE